MRLRELRGNMSQQELSDATGINQKTLSNYEVGRTEPNVQNLIRLADYFNVSLDYLCGRQWNNQIGYVPDEKREDIKNVLSLNDEQFKQVISYTQALIDTNNKKD